MPSKCTHQESLTTIRICLELTAFVIVFAVVSKFWFGLDKKLLFDDVTKLIALSIFNSTQKTRVSIVNRSQYLAHILT